MALVQGHMRMARARAVVAATAAPRRDDGRLRSRASASASASAPATTTAAPPTQQQQQQQPVQSAAALRGTWAYRVLDRVSLEAQRLEQIEAERERSGRRQVGGNDGAAAASSADPSAAENDDVGAQLDRIFEEELEPIFMSRGGYRIPPRERRELDASGGSATYGEVLPRGVRAVARGALALNAAALLASSSSSSPPPVFVDLGCGTGRAVMQVAGEFPGIARAVGIELGPTRLEQAEMALELLTKERRRRAGGGGGDNDENEKEESSSLPPPLAPVEFLLEDLRQCDLAATGGTHFYACTTAFNAALCRSLAERLANACPSFRVLATTRALPTQPHLVLLGRVEGVEYSWTGRGTCYVYARSAEDAPPEVLARLWGGGGGAGVGAVALPGATPLALMGLVAEEPMLAAMEAAAERKADSDDDD